MTKALFIGAFIVLAGIAFTGKASAACPSQGSTPAPSRMPSRTLDQIARPISGLNDQTRFNMQKNFRPFNGFKNQNTYGKTLGFLKPCNSKENCKDCESGNCDNCCEGNCQSGPCQDNNCSGGGCLSMPCGLNGCNS